MDKFNEVKDLISGMTRTERISLYYWLAKSLNEATIGISKTPGVVGGRAVLENSRISVWGLESIRRSGMSEAEMLSRDPDLTAEDLVNAWAYIAANPDEISKDIEENENEGD